MAVSIKVTIRPTTGGGEHNFSVNVPADASVLQLKQKTAEHEKCTLDAKQQRLVFKGKILADEQEISEYGIKDSDVVFMVRARATNQDQQRTAQVPTSNNTPASGAGGMGLPGLGGAQGNAMIDAITSNPEMLRTMMQGNPTVQRLIESNPQFGEIFNNPQLIAENLRAMANPELMREQMRTNDAAMRNIETMPGGYNQLRSMFESVNSALSDADRGAPAESGGTDQGLAQMLSSLGFGANTGAAPPAPAPAPPVSAGPNASPLPNPWQPSGGATAPAGLPAGLGGGLGAMGGMHGPQGEQIARMLENPAMRNMMASMMSNPQVVDSILASNPQMRQMADANPAFRQMLTNPELVQQMMRPEVLRSSMQMAQGMDAAQQGGAGAGTPASMANMLAALGAAGGGAAVQPGGAPAAPDLGAMMSMLSSMGGPAQGQQLGEGSGDGVPDVSGLMALLGGGAGAGGGFGAPAPVANPEEAYESQLQQLRDMGFFDQQENIRALQACGGNVNAAVERLLA